jgi:hypothetical protein
MALERRTRNQEWWRKSNNASWLAHSQCVESRRGTRNHSTQADGVGVCEMFFLEDRWLRWSRMTVTILNRVTRHATIRQDAERELVAIRQNGFTKIQSKQFVNEMKIYTLDQLFNKLMLIFFEMGRYKKCHIFGQVNILYP